MRKEGLIRKWQDVAEAIRTDRPATWKRKTPAKSNAGLQKVKQLKDRPTFGPPLIKSGRMLCGPENENGVLFLFGMLAWRLGFAIKKVQQAFPDVIALRKIDE